MANTPLFIGSSNIGSVRPTVAELRTDGTETNPATPSVYTLVTAAASGTRVDRISIRNSQNTYSTVANITVRFFLTDTSGLNPRLIEEILMPSLSSAKTAATAGPSNAVYFPGGLLLKSGQLLKCSVSVYTVSTQVDIVAYGGDM